MRKFISGTAMIICLSMLFETGASATTATILSDDTFGSVVSFAQETNTQKQFSIETDDTPNDFCIKAEDEESESVYNKATLVAAKKKQGNQMQVETP